MNNRLGFNLQTWEYLNFMDSCVVHSGTLTDSLKCSAQPIGQAYQLTSTTSQFYWIVPTSDNGYVMAGFITGTGAGGQDAYLVKTDHYGNQVWAKAYGGAANDYFFRVKPTSDNGYIAVGTTSSGRYASTEELLVKFDPSGNVQWTRTIGFNTVHGEMGSDVIQTSDNGYAVLGTYNTAGGTADVLLSKLDTGGNVLWSKHFGTTTSDNANSVVEKSDTLIVTGSTYVTDHYQGTLFRIDEGSGTIYKQTNYNDDNDTSTWFSYPYALAGGGYRVFMNNTYSFTSAGQHFAFMDILPNDSVAAYVRSNVPAGNTINTFGSIVPTPDGGTLFAEVGDVTPHVYWQRLTSTGSLVWSSVTNLAGTQQIFGLTGNPDTTFTVTGDDNSNGLFMMLNSSGKTGCYDSTVSLGVSFPTVTVLAGTLSVDALITASNTDTTLTLTNLTPVDSTISCAGSDSCFHIYSPPFLCGRAAPILPPLAVDSTTTCTDSTFFSTTKGTVLFSNYTDSLTGAFETTYNNVCLQAIKNEKFTVTYVNNEYHYTLYYYDQAGNLVKTVPPAGVVVNFDTTWMDSVEMAKKAGTFLVPSHTMATNYRYNALNKVISELSPDGGESNFWYDRLGRLAISQNAKQLSNAEYSYTEYDSISRIVEVGELTSSNPMMDTTARNASDLLTWITAAASTKEQITQTSYDSAYSPLQPEMYAQNLRNRVAYTAFYGTESDIGSMSPTQTTATYYSYDILGNADTLIQDYHSGIMNFTNNRFKKIVYDYDLQTRKVNKVAYQPGSLDAFYHSYLYDAENRIINVVTSTDSINWDNDAFYSYYLHGPLARTVIGDQQVQGINYSFTLQGWMKSINPPIYAGSGYTLQADGVSGSQVAINAYNLQLNFFDGDYSPISNETMPAANSSTLSSGYRPLYNGNISSMGVSVKALTNPLLYDYQYDQLNRLIHMDAYRTTDSLWTSPSILQDFQENVAYDPNGNILKYKRNGNNTFASQPLGMDSLSYFYTDGTNKLDHIIDSVPSTNYITDLDSQGVGNYGYDAIGELTQDNVSSISNVTWTVYGKIKAITKSDGSTISFTYDAAGNRISKTYDSAGGPTIITWYVMDAQGDLLSTYTSGDPGINSGDLTRTEAELYGSSRLGLKKDTVDMANLASQTKAALTLLDSANIITFIRGKKLFELNNHLGNVLATISDKKLEVSTDGSTVDHFNPLVLDANDYFPFGSLEPGRIYEASSLGYYRYGFNRKENDNEVKGPGDQLDYGMRIYDPRAGRFLSVNPLAKKYAWLTPYQFAGNNPTKFIDLDGLEPADPAAKDKREVATKKGTTDYFEWISTKVKGTKNDYKWVQGVSTMYQNGDIGANVNGSKGDNDTHYDANVKVRPMKFLFWMREKDQNSTFLRQNDFEMSFGSATSFEGTPASNDALILQNNFIKGGKGQVHFVPTSPMASLLGTDKAFVALAQSFEQQALNYYNNNKGSMAGFNGGNVLKSIGMPYIKETLFMHAVMGGTQQWNATIKRISANQIMVEYIVWDRFGAGTDDANSSLPGLGSLYWLQHNASTLDPSHTQPNAYQPFIWNITVNR